MERYEIHKMIEQFKDSLAGFERAIQPKKQEETIQALNEKMQDPHFWDQPNEARKVAQEATTLRAKVDRYYELTQKYDQLIEWFEISEEQTEEWDILEQDLHELDAELKAFELEIILNGPYDENNAILEIHPGAGGTESQDWADMLYRLYTRYAQRKNYKIEVLDYQSGDEAGLKSATLKIKGPYAYGYLKAERGVHRLVRISPFDSNARRHTSFVSIDVMPEINDEIDFEIKEDEIKVDVFRSSGAGGQSVNTTDSAVRITHLPTNTVVTCQNERSQIKNRETAMGLLKAKLLQLKLREQEAELKQIKGEQKDIAWGSQIRSYVFHPYQMVKDHRTNYEVGQIDMVMDGDIDGFINAFLKAGEMNE